MSPRIHKDSPAISISDTANTSRPTSRRSTLTRPSSASSGPSCCSTTCTSTTNQASEQEEQEPPPTKQSSVRFDTIEIQEHAYVLGDHPSVSGGVPLTIDWNPQSSLTIDFEVYHKDKPPSRTSYEMRMDHSTRMRILQSSGWSLSQIFDAVQAVETDKALRRQSYPSNSHMHCAPIRSAARAARQKLQTSFQHIGNRSFGAKNDFTSSVAKGRRRRSSA